MRHTASIDVKAGTHHHVMTVAKYPPPRLSRSAFGNRVGSNSVYSLVQCSSSLPQTVRDSYVTESYAYLRKIKLRWKVREDGSLQAKRGNNA